MKEVVLVLFGLLALGLACRNISKETCFSSRNCRCMSSETPGNIPLSQIPQLVMLTFDDAVTQSNFETTYRSLFVGNNRNPNNCSIGGTFFVTHEYNNYAEIHHLWRGGSEIAVHTITHETSTDMWRKADYDRWKSDAVGMRQLIEKYAVLPAGSVKGFRAPFLQTAGDTTFRMLKNEGFLYDSSVTTRDYAGLESNEQPIWPFTLDDGFHMDCIIEPCPKDKYPGLWVIPMVSFFRLREIVPDTPKVMMPCAMADACLPHPITEADTYDYFMENFNRHYQKNKAPLPVFLHESWLKDPARKAGYLRFVRQLLTMKDVFLVSANEVIEYMRNPVPYTVYRETRCVAKRPPQKCTVVGRTCNYQTTSLGGPRVMYSCLSPCPTSYPWLNNVV